MIRAVIDTNVLVSGLIRLGGNEALLLLAIDRGALRPCYSAEILQEYAAVLARPKFGFLPDEIAGLIAMFRGSGEIFAPQVAPALSPDPTDTKFLACAYAADAEFIVTGNKRDFPKGRYGRTRIVSAGELLPRIAMEL